jgi:hypothetical protein
MNSPLKYIIKVIDFKYDTYFVGLENSLTTLEHKALIFNTKEELEKYIEENKYFFTFFSEIKTSCLFI